MEMENKAENAEIMTPVETEEKKVAMTTAERMKKFHRTLRVNKKVMFPVVALIILLGALYACRGFFIAATVNGTPISRWSIIRELEKKSGEQALDTMVTKKLINAAAMKAGVVVSPADIDKEVATITEQISKQGGTLALALEQQGMTEAEFRDQIVLQKELEKILGDTVVVTDEDVNQYMTQSKAVPPKGTSVEDFKNQIRESLKGQKFNKEASNWVTGTKAKAEINYFVDYAPKPLPIEDLSEGAISSELKQ